MSKIWQLTYTPTFPISHASPVRPAQRHPQILPFFPHPLHPLMQAPTTSHGPGEECSLDRSPYNQATVFQLSPPNDKINFKKKK